MPLLDVSIMNAHFIHDQSFTGRSHDPSTVVEVLAHQNYYDDFNSSHHTSELDPTTGQRTVYIHATTFTQPDSFVPARP